MTNRILLYNSGGGLGDAIQILPLINSLKREFTNAEFYYLSAHQNHFNTTLKDFNTTIKTLDLELKYFGFRWWHILFAKKKLKKKNIQLFDLIIDLQSKIRNTLILKSIPHKSFISTSLNFMLSKPILKIKKYKKINYTIAEAINYIFKKNFLIEEFNINEIDKKILIESERLLPKNNYVGFSITQGNVYRKKEWPLDRIIEVSQILVKKNKIPVFLIEKKYTDIINKIKNAVPSSLFPENESNINSPALVTCLGKRLEFVISIDNGIMHMLSLSKVPIISLFGPTDSEKFAPDYKNSIILDSKKIYKSNDVSAITVEDVLLAAKQFLNS